MAEGSSAAFLALPGNVCRAPQYHLDPPAPDPYSMTREVEDVLALAEAIGEPMVVVGHSSGGVVALEALAASRASGPLFTTRAGRRKGQPEARRMPALRSRRPGGGRGVRRPRTTRRCDRGRHSLDRHPPAPSPPGSPNRQEADDPGPPRSALPGEDGEGRDTQVSGKLREAAPDPLGRGLGICSRD